MHLSSLIFLHDVSQVPAALSLFTACKVRGEEVRIFAAGADIEFLLDSRKVPYISARECRTSSVERIARAEEYPQKVFADPAWPSFSYRGVPLGKVFGVPLQVYLTRLFYAFDLVAGLFQLCPDITRVYIYEPFVPARCSLWACEKLVWIRCLELQCRFRRVECVVLASPQERKKWFLLKLFELTHLLFGVGIAFLNTVISLRPRRPLRILASESWKNISALMKQLPEAELVLLDRAEVRAIGVRTAWRHRTLFLHLFGGLRDEESAARLMQGYKDISMRRYPLTYAGVELGEVFQEALTGLMKVEMLEVLRTIDAAYATIEHFKPNLILLRATASYQKHFPVLALVAEKLSIPVLELQHGGHEYMGPGSFSRKHHCAKYMAVFGPLVRDEMAAQGYDVSSLFPTGSARFDAYASVRPVPHEGFSLLCIAPSVIYEALFDTYDVVDFFWSVAAAVRGVPDANVIIKLKPGISHVDFYREAARRNFDNIPYTIIEKTPPVTLFTRVDAVVSCHSTSVLEAFISGVPVAVAAFNAVEQAITKTHYEQYEREGALLLTHTASELREAVSLLAASPERRLQLTDRAKDAIRRHHAFDGESSKRLADLIRTLAHG